jgi:tetratricopeptide (TPR) repeat protein
MRLDVVDELVNKGLELSEQGKYEQANDYFDKANRMLRRNHSRGMVNESVHLFLSGRIKDSIKCYKPAIDSRPPLQYTEL